MFALRMLALVVFLATFVTAQNHSANLTITIRGVRNDSGSVLAAVYDADKSFMKVQLAKATLKAKANKGEVEFVVHDLHAGKYAVSVFHDENDNGKLDKNWMGIPTEGYGFSNDARGNLGPPKFTQAAFDFDGNSSKSIDVSLHY